MTADELRDWVPIRVYWAQGEVTVDWCHVGTERFTDPFFADTVRRCLGKPFALLFRHQTSADVLDEFAAVGDSVQPSGFIFHMSRCGSTLVSQMLAANPAHIVMSEPGPVDAVLRSHLTHHGATDEQRVRWFRGLLAAYGRRRTGREQKLFVKFDSWSVLELPLIRQAFPDVPCIFVYRDPVEVLASHVREPGSHMVPGMLPPSLFGVVPNDLPTIPLREYGARVLGSICAAAIRQQAATPMHLVDYRQLPGVMVSQLVDLFGVHPTADDIDAMEEVALVHAKRPHERFEPDAERKSADASDELRALCREWVDPWYVQLVALQSASTPHGIGSRAMS